MTNFYERQMQRIFGESELLSADTVFAGKAMISDIGGDLRAKVEFVAARVSGQYEGLKLSIINRKEGLGSKITTDIADHRLSRKHGIGGE